ncbi:hypothetical protein [Acidianus infernus]|nr:hypothetical protein [Acidianus infernus]
MENTYEENGHQVLICIPRSVIFSIRRYKVVKYEACINDTIITQPSCADI